MSRYILSIDLSMNLAAFVLGEITDRKYKVVKTYYVDNKRGKLTHAQKLYKIAKELITIKKEYDEVDIVARERGFYRFAQATQTLYKVIGVCDFLLLNLYGITEVEELPPTEVKALVTGNGRSGKDEVESAVRERLKEVGQDEIYFYSDDVSDAAAVGIAYALKNNLID